MEPRPHRQVFRFPPFRRRWLNPLMWLGSRRDLELGDLFGVPQGDESDNLGDELQRQWEHELRKANVSDGHLDTEQTTTKEGQKMKRPSLLKAIVRTFGGKYAAAGIIVFFEECVLRVAQPVFMALLIRYFSGNWKYGNETYWGWLFGTGVILCSLLYIFTHHAVFFNIGRYGMQIRVACGSIIYRKALRLSKCALGRTTSGQMVNLLSNDVNRFDQSVIYLHYLWIGPIQAIISTAILWLEFGISSLSGIAFLILFASSQGSPLASCPDAIGRVFLAVAVYNNIRMTMTYYFPFGVAQAAETVISIKRLQEFLLHEELRKPNHYMVSSPGVLGDADQRKSTKPLSKNGNPGIEMKNAIASWTKGRESIVLDGVSVSVKPGQLVAVIGPVGSGKSSMVQAILGELPLETGELQVRGRLAYTGQEPWVFAGSIRENITLGKSYDGALFSRVVHACALHKDLDHFPHRERSLVGDRGITLSGGQKARISLARALYQEADIYLLDDPLSAVDAHVGRHLFNKCIMGYLKDKPRILVTHQLQFLQTADGKVATSGTYNELLKSGVDFTKLMAKHETSQHLEEELSSTRINRTCSNESLPSLDVQSYTNEGSTTKLGDKASAPTLAEETRSRGSLSARIYWDYLKAGAGWFLRLLLIVSYILTQCAFSGSDWWLSYWTNAQQEAANRTNSSAVELLFGNPLLDPWTPMYIYVAIVVALFLLSIFRTVLFFYICMNSSINLHSCMFKSVLRAPVAFFDNNPVGRILNRFSNDVGASDDMLPPTACDSLGVAFHILGVSVLLCIVNYYVIICTIVIMVAFSCLRHFYLNTARDLKRLESITRSPVFSHLSASLNGLATIRASHDEDIFIKGFDNHQDLHTSTWFVFLSGTRWFGIWLDWLIVAYLAAITYSFMGIGREALGGDVGLAISSAIMLAGIFQLGVRQSAELENQMVSVERIMEYSRLKEEAALESPPDKKPPLGWPSEGHVKFEHVSLRYAPDSSPVLKDLTFTIAAKEKVGIVGRTGAGKSSLITVLFRLTEPEGRILLDGRETKAYGLHEVRRGIAIIPQDPVLFQGTMRRNLDPFDEHSDEALWKVLEQVQLKQPVSEMKEKLDTKLSEGGSNFSVGQRQLVCLARALLRQNKILILDEATANVDPETDALIQDTLRRSFSDCTVLTIAHRLDTIIDSDKVLVLDHGEIKELGQPHELLQNENGFFSDLVGQTGPGAAKRLRLAAARATLWQENRRLTMLILKDFTFRKREVVDLIIQDAVLLLCGFLKENQRKPLHLGPCLNLAITNIIWKMVVGPWGLPILGYAPFLLGEYKYLKMNSLRKKHGDIFTISLLNYDVVILSDWELVRDFFGRLEISGRPNIFIVREPASHGLGIALSQGSIWLENRRFTMRILKDFGLGKKEALDSMIQDSAITLCRFLSRNQHEPQDLGPHLNLAILNIIWKIIAGRQFSQDDAKMQGVMIGLEEVFFDSSILGNFHLAPLLVFFWPPALRAYRRIHRNLAVITKVFSDEVEEHKKSLPLSGEPSDYIEAYLMEMAKQKAQGEINPNFSELGLQTNIADMFIAGSETTASSIRWCVLFLLCHPEIQEKLQAEVDNVVGPDRLPSLDDRDRFHFDLGMPFTQAFIMEVLRLSHLGPFGVPHVATEDVEIAGYRYPKKFTFRTTTGLPHPKAEAVGSFAVNPPKPFQFLVEERKH
ncbi:unnamed protein product [Darwinula stevensoni]|uniref:Uncharacterized protein n=1 Tax=Darwinula stevensoni TaxID=69355 RepID=A0A7R9FNQ1_9CRUS|nr:unnamed protein product [Darwinula stevensoni]CAG0897047.1 unnamed protein product [Darwinula stevensoni]